MNGMKDATEMGTELHNKWEQARSLGGVLVGSEMNLKTMAILLPDTIVHLPKEPLFDIMPIVHLQKGHEMVEKTENEKKIDFLLGRK